MRPRLCGNATDAPPEVRSRLPRTHDRTHTHTTSMLKADGHKSSHPLGHRRLSAPDVALTPRTCGCGHWQAAPSAEQQAARAARPCPPTLNPNRSSLQVAEAKYDKSTGPLVIADTQAEAVAALGEAAALALEQQSARVRGTCTLCVLRRRGVGKGRRDRRSWSRWGGLSVGPSSPGGAAAAQQRGGRGQGSKERDCRPRVTTACGQRPWAPACNPLFAGVFCARAAAHGSADGPCAEGPAGP